MSDLERNIQSSWLGSGRNDALTINRLEEWARSGAHWRVIHLSDRRAVVELQQCTGEPIERLESGTPDLIAYLQGVESDLDLASPTWTSTAADDRRMTAETLTGKPRLTRHDLEERRRGHGTDPGGHTWTGWPSR